VLISAEGHVRLADFGLCKYLPPSNPLTATICGTYVYVSPEALAARHYSRSVDVWALGIFIYHMYRGRTPFEGKDLDQVVQKMNARQIRFPSTASDELVHLIKRLLDWQPSSRLGCGGRGVADIRDHPFFASVDWDSVSRLAYNPDALYNFEKENKTPPLALNAKEMLQIAIDVASSPVSKSSSGARSKSVGSSSAFAPASASVSSPMLAARVGKHSGISPATLTETSPPAEDDLLRNFCLDEWKSVSIDNDFDDLAYGDQRLWPMKSVAKMLEDDRIVVGFDFTYYP
jgi:serine/threonine protein kinase